MANPTTNYGFVLPTTTDLVTDLPADFDVALQGVDTRLKALQPGTTSGDLAYSSATANTNVRLAIGTSGQVLAVVSGVPAWATTADQTPLTTKGDIFTFSTVDARVGVGANNTVLTADSAEATGLKWAAPGGAGKNFTLLNAGGTALTGATSITVSGISNADCILIAIKEAQTVSAGATINLRFNADSGNNYDQFRAQTGSGGATFDKQRFGSQTQINNNFCVFSINASGDAASVSSGYCYLFGAAAAGVKTYWGVGAGNLASGSANNAEQRFFGGVYNSSSTITSVSILNDTGTNFNGGTIFIYTSA